MHDGCRVRMAERSKALRSGRSLVLQAWVRIPLLTKFFVVVVDFSLLFYFFNVFIIPTFLFFARLGRNMFFLFSCF